MLPRVHSGAAAGAAGRVRPSAWWRGQGTGYRWIQGTAGYRVPLDTGYRWIQGTAGWFGRWASAASFDSPVARRGTAAWPLRWRRAAQAAAAPAGAVGPRLRALALFLLPSFRPQEVVKIANVAQGPNAGPSTRYLYDTVHVLGNLSIPVPILSTRTEEKGGRRAAATDPPGGTAWPAGSPLA